KAKNKSPLVPLFQRGIKEDKSPLVPLFQRGMIIKVISPLWKRGGRGDFISFKSPFFPLFQRGIIRQVKFPSLEKRG
ncbi:MAG TPA: hypothetical protein PLF61_04215, partial [Candidatus Goldiibacteriota bacterium]|nr:hypothetical protein [Candidatus Goldiibacteriota bacterium]